MHIANLTYGFVIVPVEFGDALRQMPLREAHFNDARHGLIRHDIDLARHASPVDQRGDW